MDKPSLGAIPFHPILFALYFVLALLGLNITQVYTVEAIRSLVVVLVFSIVIFILMRLVYSQWQRGALSASLILVLFFTYGHVYNFLEKNIAGFGRHRLLLPLWVMLAILGLWLIARRLKNPFTLNMTLNVVALVAVSFPLFQIFNWNISLAQPGENSTVEVSDIGSLHLPVNQTPPDVYFFIIDEYTRQDVLLDVYHFDNSVFLNALRQMGFQVIECSQANYSQTEMVLTSILNMNYLDTLDQFDPSTTDYLALYRLIKNNFVMHAFDALGYKLVSFETGFHFSEFYSADYYLAPGDASTSIFGRMSSFELMLLKSTGGLVFYDSAKILPSFLASASSQPLETKRQLVLYDLKELKKIPQSISGPKFIFAHILALHVPYAFSSDGQPMVYPDMLEGEQYHNAYLDQLIFMNSQLLPILQNIIDNSTPKPIIIFQSDTGPGMVSHAQRMANFSAFYLPGYHSSLSQTFSPVNDFRLIFDQYFGASLDLLPAESYFSLYTSQFDLIPIQNDCIPPR